MNNIASLILEKFSDKLNLEFSENLEQSTISTPKEGLLELASFLKNDSQCYFDSLSCITAIDNGPDKGSIDVLYELYSIPFGHKIRLKVTVARDNETIDSVTDLWASANWDEREAYDLVGIKFNNHPDLRRILLPEDWHGHPLRKDYVEQEKYHGITVKYSNNHE
jgi:NADH-quinone oxidoreductase subunit C